MALIVDLAALRRLPGRSPGCRASSSGCGWWAPLCCWWLGGRAWRAAWRDTGEEVAAPGRPTRRGWWAVFGEGLLVQLANPKAALFMVAFHPQFVPAE